MNRSAFRITRTKYTVPPCDPFDGEGSARLPGRWNRDGVKMVYTSWSLSLAILETLVHSHGELHGLKQLMVCEISVPENLIEWLSRDRLPGNWADPEHFPPGVSELGVNWIREGATPAFAVPSSVVPIEWNFLLNPAHRDFHKIVRQPYLPLPIDPRLLTP